MISLLVSDFRKISVSVPSIPVAVLGLTDQPKSGGTPGTPRDDRPANNIFFSRKKETL